MQHKICSLLFPNEDGLVIDEDDKKTEKMSKFILWIIVMLMFQMPYMTLLIRTAYGREFMFSTVLDWGLTIFIDIDVLQSSLSKI